MTYVFHHLRSIAANYLIYPKCEDWQGDKADVSLGEGIQPKKVVQVLDSAESWLSSPEGQSTSINVLEYWNVDCLVSYEPSVSGRTFI